MPAGRSPLTLTCTRCCRRLASILSDQRQSRSSSRAAARASRSSILRDGYHRRAFSPSTSAARASVMRLARPRSSNPQCRVWTGRHPSCWRTRPQVRRDPGEWRVASHGWHACRLAQAARSSQSWRVHAARVLQRACPDRGGLSALIHRGAWFRARSGGNPPCARCDRSVAGRRSDPAQRACSGFLHHERMPRFPVSRRGAASRSSRRSPRFSLGKLRNFEFLGFQLSRETAGQYAAANPEDPTMTVFDRWQAFERAHPRSFLRHISVLGAARRGADWDQALTQAARERLAMPP